MNDQGRMNASERLLEAAGEVFAEHGYHAATVRQITQRAGVNIAAINYYFRDKEELYAAVLQHAHRASLCQSAAFDETRPPEDRLRDFVHDMLRHVLNPQRPEWHGQLMSREMSAPTKMFHELIDQSMRPKCERLLKLLADLAPGLPETKLRLLACSILGQCLFYRHSRTIVVRLFPEILEPEDYIERLSGHIYEFSLEAIRHAAGLPRREARQRGKASV